MCQDVMLQGGWRGWSSNPEACEEAEIAAGGASHTDEYTAFSMYDSSNSVGLDKISITKAGDNNYRQLHNKVKKQKKKHIHTKKHIYTHTHTHTSIWHLYLELELSTNLSSNYVSIT